MPQVFKRAAARRDLVDHYVYLAANAGEETADRFLTQAEQTFADLAQQREIGAPLTHRLMPSECFGLMEGYQARV